MKEEEFNRIKRNLNYREIILIESLYEFNGKVKLSKEELSCIYEISVAYISRLETKIIRKIKRLPFKPLYFRL